MSKKSLFAGIARKQAFFRLNSLPRFGGAEGLPAAKQRAERGGGFVFSGHPKSFVG